MEKFIEFILEKAYNETIALLFLVGGMVLGGVLAFFIYKIFAIKSKQSKKAETLSDITLIKREAVDIFENNDDDLNISQLTAISQAISVLLNEIPLTYNKKTKFRTVLSAEEISFLEQDLKISLDFTVYQAIYFLRAFFKELKVEILKILNSKEVKLVYGVGKIANKLTLKQDNVTKRVEDLKLSTVIEIIKSIREKTQKKEANEQKGFLKKIFDKVKGKGVTIAKEKTLDFLEPYVIEIIEIFAEKINLLYSGQIAREETFFSLNDLSEKESA